jgi:hypothetical protein
LPTKPPSDFVPSPPTRDMDVETGKYSVYHRRREVQKAASTRCPKIKVSQRVFECSRLAGCAFLCAIHEIINSWVSRWSNRSQFKSENVCTPSYRRLRICIDRSYRVGLSQRLSKACSATRSNSLTIAVITASRSRAPFTLSNSLDLTSIRNPIVLAWPSGDPRGWHLGLVVLLPFPFPS